MMYLPAHLSYLTFNYFPKDTIHVVVVDPEVGSNRRPIIARASDHYFIGRTMVCYRSSSPEIKAPLYADYC